MPSLYKRLLGGRSPDDAAVRGQMGIVGGVAGIIINALIFAMEITVGLLVGSVAVTADAFHNLTDVVSSAITIASFKFANKPADKEHPFGHGRVEYLSALFVAMVIMVIGFEFLKTSFERILHPTPVMFNLLSLLLMLAAIPLKLLLGAFNKGLGRLIHSSMLEATSFDALSDVLVLSVASLSIIASAFTKVHIDGVLGVLVAVFIMYSGFRIAHRELNPLLGEAPDKGLVKSIEDGVLEAQYVSGVHDLIIHNYGPSRFMATIHAEVPCDVPILSVHESIDRAEKELSKKLGIILVIHMDPLNNDDETVKNARALVMDVLAGFPQAVSIHDFRAVGDEHYMNLIFDVVAGPGVVTKRDEDELSSGIGAAVKSAEPHYNAVISVDRNYTA